jgi:hypothetical protein
VRARDARKEETGMDLIRIDDNKLKIMLTPVDMQSYALDDTMDYTKDETRQAFRSIMSEVRSRTGFDAEGNRVYVQLYPSRSGGCEMFVTKLGTEKKDGEKPAATPQKRDPTPKEYAYVFSSLSHLLMASRRLRGDFSGTARAFTDRGKKEYFLILSEDAPVLTEYEGRRCKSREIPYILEYGRCFCEDAPGILSELV